MEPDDPQAAELERAFHSLQCRTRAGVLRAGESAVELDDALEVWRNLIRMSSGQSTAIRRLAAPSLRPELELEPAAGEVALPARIDWFERATENRRVYRFLALQLAGRREFGTYTDAGLLARLRRGHDGPTPLEALFSLAEGVRIQLRIARAYPGSAQETEALAQALLARWQSAAEVDQLDYLLALALVPQPTAALPAWLPRAAAERVLAVLAPLRDAAASVEHSIQAAERLLFWTVSASSAASTSKTLSLERMDSVASEAQAAAAASSAGAEGAEPGDPDPDADEASSGGQLRDGSSGDVPAASSSQPPLGAAQRAYARLTARHAASAQTAAGIAAYTSCRPNTTQASSSITPGAARQACSTTYAGSSSASDPSATARCAAWKTAKTWT
jgi:hypothetical protein